jgi:hypothetical protein
MAATSGAGPSSFVTPTRHSPQPHAHAPSSTLSSLGTGGGGSIIGHRRSDSSMAGAVAVGGGGGGMIDEEKRASLMEKAKRLWINKQTEQRRLADQVS